MSTSNSPALGVCTILAKNYVSLARTLFQSLQFHHGSIKCYALIIDEWEGYINPADECFEIVPIAEIGIPDIASMSFKYDITEFSTAVKPFLLEHLLSIGKVDKLLYLDPDILVTRSLNGLFDALDRFDWVLIPHLDADYPDDDFIPNDGTILIHGVFNLGFLGVRRSKTVEALLKWWQHKLKVKCVQAEHIGYYVDQRFIDLAITLFPNFHIERDVGYDVAYWNVHSRKLSRHAGEWRCNDGPLYFFHFSGYAFNRQDLISRHCLRYMRRDRPDLEPIFAEYKSRLIENGFSDTSEWKYTYGYFGTGQPIPYESRIRYRNAINEGVEVPDPFHSPGRLRAALWAARKRKQGWRAAVLEELKDFMRPLTPPIVWELFRSLNQEWLRRKLSRPRTVLGGRQ